MWPRFEGRGRPNLYAGTRKMTGQPAVLIAFTLGATALSVKLGRAVYSLSADDALNNSPRRSGILAFWSSGESVMQFHIRYKPNLRGGIVTRLHKDGPPGRRPGAAWG